MKTSRALLRHIQVSRETLLNITIIEHDHYHGRSPRHQGSGVCGRFFLAWKETVGPSMASLARGRRIDGEKA
jgi:hypothetical protein